METQDDTYNVMIKQREEEDTQTMPGAASLSLANYIEIPTVVYTR